MNLTDKYNRLVGQKKLLIQQLKEKKERRTVLVEDKEVYEKARWVITEASRINQQFFKDKVESLVTMAIQSVFDRPFEFKLIMERKRNKLECRPVIMEGENEYSPKDEMGGGLVDIISFAFRVVLWSVEKPRSRSIFILDEPFKFTGALVGRAGEMVKELSKTLGIQIIIVTHDEALKEIADVAYTVTHDGTKSHVELTKDELMILNMPKAVKRLRRRRTK